MSTNTITNVTNTVVEATKPAQETINSVMLSMLRGARDVGAEIYSASKQSLIAAVDFAQEQAPLVVQEFLKWHLAKASIHLFFCIAFTIFSIWLYRKLYVTWKTAKNIDSEVIPFVIAIFYSALFMYITIFSTIPSMEKVAQITLAPRVYLIEYAVEQSKQFKK